jgi:hypothetical protein
MTAIMNKVLKFYKAAWSFYPWLSDSQPGYIYSLFNDLMLGWEGQESVEICG